MRASRRGLAWILIWLGLLGAEFADIDSARGQGGGKPKPPDINRPICFQAYQWKGNRNVLKRANAGGTSVITVNSDVYSSDWPRWSPDGRMIGGYHKNVDRDTALMVMNHDATNEQVVMTAGQFNAWNLARPGVLDSEYYSGWGRSYNCWLGDAAFVFAGKTTYDATFFGGLPGETITAVRLFIVDATGNFTPLTEDAAFGTTFEDTNPHWSAALNKIVFVGSRTVADKQLYAINPDGTGLMRITNFGWQPQHAVWSPAGDRLAVCEGQASNELWLLEVDLSQPNPGTGEGGRVTAALPFQASDTHVSTPSWSPDGLFLVYSRGSNASLGYPNGEYIAIADVATGAESIVYGPASSSGGPDWDPLDVLP
jgi:Tol biopolymer transport system component